MTSTIGWYYIESQAGAPMGLYQGEEPDDAVAAMDAEAGAPPGGTYEKDLVLKPAEDLVEQGGYALRITELVRTALGITQIQMAERMGVTGRTIQTWEGDGIPDERTRMALLYMLEHHLRYRR